MTKALTGREVTKELSNWQIWLAFQFWGGDAEGGSLRFVLHEFSNH